jgi:hypothetical protein
MLTRKATFNIENILLEEVKFLLNMIKRTIFIEQQIMYEKEMEEASHDPLYLQDIKKITEDFAKLDIESAEFIQ